MKLRKRLLAGLAVPVLAGTGALAAAGTAHAAVPNVNSNGVVGYSAVQNGNNAYFTHQVSQFGLGDPQYSVNNPSIPVNPVLAAVLSHLHVGTWNSFSLPAGLNVQAARVGFCGGTREYGRNADAGTTVQELLIPVSASRYDVLAVAGVLPASGGDVCLSSELPAGEASLVLKNVPVSDTVQMQLLYDGNHAHNGVGAGRATFVATDLSHPTTSQVNTPGPVFTHHADSEFFEAENGIIGATGPGTATASLPATVLPDSRFPNNAVVEAHVLLNANDTATGNEVQATLQSNAAWDAVPDASQVGGVIVGAPSVFKSDHFTSFVASGVWPAQAAG
jgi:hypothetical protein